MMERLELERLREVEKMLEGVRRMEKM